MRVVMAADGSLCAVLKTEGQKTDDRITWTGVPSLGTGG
jgi:hypothetical protein